MRVLFKKTAIDDIKASADYIAENLHNKASAKKLSESIYRTAMMLSDSPYLGARLSGKYDVETDLRYLIVSRHLIFYRVDAKRRFIYLEDIFDERQPYRSLL